MDTLERLRRRRPEICSWCGWNMVLTEVGYECGNVQECIGYSAIDPDDPKTPKRLKKLRRLELNL